MENDKSNNKHFSPSNFFYLSTLSNNSNEDIQHYLYTYMLILDFCPP